MLLEQSADAGTRRRNIDKDLQESKDPHVVSYPDTTWGLTILFLVHGNPQHALKDKGVIDSGCSRHMIGNMSYRSDFEELNGGYVAFGGNLKGGKISGKGKIKTEKLDFDDVYFVKELKFNIFSVSQMCDKKNSVLFTDSECLVLSPEFKLPDENQKKQGRIVFNNMCFFPVWSSSSTNPQNTNDDAAFGSKKPEFEGRKPESEVYVSPSSSAQTKKHDNKTKREAKGKSPVESLIGYRNLSAEFKDFFDNSNNEVNAAGSLVLAVVQIFTNSTNTFSATGPSNTAVSPTHGKSSYVDTSQLPNYPNMPELEDITYSGDEEDVGHTQEEGIDYEEVFAPVARIEAIRLFLAYASFMGFMVYQMNVKSAFLYGTIEEEVYVYQPPGFEDPDYPDKVYKVVKYGLHQAPRAWYETLANYLLENDFQRGKIDQTLFIKRQKDLCKAFEILMKDKFQMSSMGELTFFLAEILRKFSLTYGKSVSILIDTEKPLLKDLDDTNYAGASLDRKSTTGGCHILRCRLISWQCKKQTVMATSSIEAGPDQTVSGKDSSNPLYSTHHVALIKSWLLQKQTALGKDKSNPFIVDSSLKTIW
nr:putative ribonuclease H-like domain-containing protein [Tanacetum cinerariifolium]